MTPRIITDIKSFDVDYLPVNIESFRDWLNNQIDKIPEEFRKNSSISIERNCFDADAPIKFKINMMRYETETERKKAKRAKESYELAKKNKLKKEREQYEKLRKKFEKPSS